MNIAKKILSQKGEINTIIITILLIAAVVIPVTTKLVQQRQEIRKKADSAAPSCPSDSKLLKAYGECCACNTAKEVKKCQYPDGRIIYRQSTCDHKNQSVCGYLCPSPSPSTSSSAPPASSKACHLGCCGGPCGDCPLGQACNIPNGACLSGYSCNPAGYEYHSACRDLQCVKVPGPGEDKCEKYGGDDYCRQQGKQPKICTPNTCCGENLKCNSVGTACNVPDKTGECAKKYKCWPNNCCQEGYRCNSAGTDCNVQDVKCTQNPPTPTPTPTSAPSPTLKPTIRPTITSPTPTKTTPSPTRISPSPTKPPAPSPTLTPLYLPCYHPYLCSYNLQKICLPYAYTETESRLGWYPCPEGSRCVFGQGCDFPPTPKYSYPQRVQMCQGKQEGNCLDSRGRCITFYGGELHGKIAYQSCPAGTTCIGSSCVPPTPTIKKPSPQVPTKATPSPSDISPTSVSRLPTLTPTPTPMTSSFLGFTFKYCSPANRNYIFTAGLPPKREPCGYLRICQGLPLFAKCVDLPKISFDELPVVTYTPTPELSICSTEADIGNCCSQISFCAKDPIYNKITCLPCHSGFICQKGSCVPGLPN